MMEYDIHTVLDIMTFLATAWVVYTIYIPLASTYQREQDSVHTIYVVRILVKSGGLAALLIT